MSKSWLRVEARPLKMEEMFEDQKRVVRQLEATIKWAKENQQSPTRKCTDEGVTPSSAHTNRMLFLHGVSGVGKTSVYLTIRDRDHGEDKPAVWLDPLEFGILKDAPNALSDMLALIEDKVKGGSSKLGDGHLGQEKNDCIKRLRQLQNRISEVWDGAQKSRAVQIPPQAFAAEVVEVSRWRAKLRCELNELIDEVSRCFFDGRLLILPIDDMHEHPGMALETLRLLRLIHSSRFLTLAIGDFDLLKDIERLRILKEMGYAESSSSRIEGQIEMQAVYSLSKTVPVAQRFELMPPDPGEDSIVNLMGFKPSKTMPDMLGELLDEMDVCKYEEMGVCKYGEMGVRKFMEVNDAAKRAGKRAWLFKVSARHLVDMYMELSTEKWERAKRKEREVESERQEGVKPFAQDFAWRQFDVLVRTTGWFDDDDVKSLRRMIRPQTGVSTLALEIDNRLVFRITKNATGALGTLGEAGATGLLFVQRPNGKRIELYHAIQAWLRLTMSLVEPEKCDFKDDTLLISLAE